MKTYLKLLSQRESKEVLGKNNWNLVFLTLVLFATFASIAFSNGSMSYLEEKMNDPFTNWVNIPKRHASDKFDELMKELSSNDSLGEKYGFDDIQRDTYWPMTMLGRRNEPHLLDCRFFEKLSSPLIKKVLDNENLVSGCSVEIELLNDNSLGVIITDEVLKKLGYTSDSIPSYIKYEAMSKGAEDFGFRLKDSKYYGIPLPLLAVVKKLPQNMDMVASHFLYEQYMNGNTFPLNMSHEEYARTLYYFIPEEIDNPSSTLESCLTQDIRNNIVEDQIDNMLSWKKGSIWQIYVGDGTTELSTIWEVDSIIQHKLSGEGVVRIYRYEVSSYPIAERNFLSVNFNTLEHIRDFESYAKDNYNVQIEMSQVNSKEAFNDVSDLAKILSVAMILFSLLCIILFIVNMLNSYFQKVKRNLGTFKAFGMSTSELIKVYLIIMLRIVLTAVLFAVILAFIIQLVLPLCGLQREGGFDYFSLFCWEFLGSIVAVFAATVITVYVKMNELLEQTPGDLIYDR